MLIKCPECQKDVSSEAPLCVHCGYPLKNRTTAETNEVVPKRVSEPDAAPKPKKRLSRSGALLVCLGLVGLVVAFFVRNPERLWYTIWTLGGTVNRVTHYKEADEEERI